MASKVGRILENNPNLTEGDALQKIGDSVRGTVIVDSTDQMREAIKHLRANSQKRGVKLFVDNKFRDTNQVRKGGYAAVHCDVEFRAASGRTVRGEIQFQLSTVHNGEADSIKEANHALYEIGQGRDGVKPSKSLKKKVNWAGVFMFTQALAVHIPGLQKATA